MDLKIMGNFCTFALFKQISPFSSFCMQTFNVKTCMYIQFTMFIVYCYESFVWRLFSFGVIFVPCLDISHFLFNIHNSRRTYFFFTFFSLSFYFSILLLNSFFFLLHSYFHLTEQQRERLKSSVCNLAYS